MTKQIEFAPLSAVPARSSLLMKKAGFFLAACCLALLAGCATGPLYKDVKPVGALTPPQGKAMTIVYRTPGFAGALAKLEIWANDQRLGAPLQRGGFLTYVAEPGAVTFKTSNGSGNAGLDFAQGGLLGIASGYKKEHPTLEVEPNQIYFLEPRSGMWREKLVVVATEEAEKAIQECHWLNAPGAQK